MQIKIAIGTIAFMLTMIILGFAALSEPARLQTYTGARDGRFIEKGAEVFEANCATCHGVNGKAEECYAAATGEQIGCQGLPLNNADLLCGNPPPRIAAQGWEGTTFDYIRGTVTSCRPWNGMPTWAQEFGGPLQEDQVYNVALFVSNWQNDELCSGPPPEAVAWPTSVAELPEGNPDNGPQLYNVTYGCTACHGNPAETGSNLVGPWLGEIASIGATRLDGYTAADYMYESMLHPSNFIAPDCPNGPCTGPPSSMPANFGQRMSLQDMADILSYLLGTTTFESTAEVVYP